MLGCDVMENAWNFLDQKILVPQDPGITNYKTSPDEKILVFVI